MTRDGVPEFTGDELTGLLRELGARLSARGIAASGYVIGGYAIATQIDSRRLTEDVDGMFRPYAEVKSEADRLADERGIPRSWLNDRAFAFIAFDPDADDPDGAVVALDGLSLRLASPRVLLAMKIAAGRAKDTDDIAQLIRQLGITDPSDVVDIAFHVFGEDGTTLTDSRESVYFQAEDAIRQAYS